MRRAAGTLAIILAASLATVWGQSGAHIGYVYPAGGQRGTTFRVAVGGQLLTAADGVYVSGQGVTASVVQYVRPLNAQELSYTSSVMRDLVRRRWSLNTMRYLAQAEDPPRLPDHPWLRDLSEKSPAELARLRANLFDPRKQMNAQIAEQVEIEVTIDPGAASGDRELRLITATGLTNPMCFQIGVLPEVGEERAVTPGQPDPVPTALPAVLNGQIQPGEVDRFSLRARQGQQLVLRMAARHLIPYLADAVPGWFQATMSLRDAAGREVAYDDDYRFDPDPLLVYKVPADGVYRLEVRDAIYRGRDDFVYRVTIGELPLVTSMFPLGGPSGVATTASLNGWNLPATTLALATTPGGETIRTARLSNAQGLYDELSYAVDTLPESREEEPNNAAGQAQPVVLPVIVNGRLGREGDVDIFSWEGRGGDEVVAQIAARRLNSPLDSVLQITDDAGGVVAANDDHEDRTLGLVTHQADSYLRAKLPRDGVYRVRVSEAQGQGGEAFGYRLRLSSPRPDFAVRVTPSAANLRAGQSALLTAQVIRTDGFTGEVEFALKNAPAGYTLSSAPLAADSDTVTLKLTAPRDASRQVLAVALEARATVAGAPVTRPVMPAENLMQAFAYWHLVVQQELLVAVAGGGTRPVPAVWLPLLAGARPAVAGPVRLPLGGHVQVSVNVPQMAPTTSFTLARPMRGVTLTGATVTATGVTLTLKADPLLAQAGQAGNLIVEAYTGPETRRGPKHSLGVLPVLACQVVLP